MDAKIPELFIKSLAGLYQEGTIRCIMDIAETYSDRPAGMHDIARGQCRSLSEDPMRRKNIDMPSATAAPRALKPLETIYEDEMGDAVDGGGFVPAPDADPDPDGDGGHVGHLGGDDAGTVGEESLLIHGVGRCERKGDGGDGFSS
jgi:hypothetical protein